MAQSPFHSNPQSRKTFVSAKRMLACDGCWPLTAFRFHNYRPRRRLPPKPSSRPLQWTKRSEPEGESRCFAGERMSTHGDGRTMMAARLCASAREGLEGHQQKPPGGSQEGRPEDTEVPPND